MTDRFVVLNMSYSILPVGARLYVSGNTFAIKDQLRNLGAHLDSDRKEWWVGRAKEQALRDLLKSIETNHVPSNEGKSRAVAPSTKVRGKATYKGRTYYVIASAKDDSALLLTTLDGSISFWGRGATWVKSFGRRDNRTNYTEYPTLESIRRYAQRKDQRSSILAEIEMLEDMDRFEEARSLAQKHGIPY